MNNFTRKLLCLLLLLLIGAVEGAAQQTVQGRVTNEETLEPISSVLVSVQGAQAGVLTNAQGQYTIEAPPDGTLEFSLIGFTLQRVPVAGRSTVDVSLRSTALQLDEIVAVGYTQQTRRSIAGSVATVDAADIEARMVTTVQDALRGRLPGVNIRNSGQPGVTAVVDIRGRAFTEDNSPLYVVDGMYLRDLRNLNPNDIESIQVLKDASAASQYGAQAANGVVVISTRRGRAAAGNRVTIQSSYGYQDIPRLLPMMNAQQWAELTRMKYENARERDPTSPTVPAGAFDVLEGRNTFDTDWQDEVTRSGYVHDHVLSMSGGTAVGDANYFVSGGYTNQQGTLRETAFERITMRVNSELRRGRFTLGENVMFSSSDRNDPTINQLSQAVCMIPPIPVYNTPDGSHGNDKYGHGTANYPTFCSNPVGGTELEDQVAERNELFGTAYGEVDILNGLQYRLNIGFRYNDDRGESFEREGMIRQNTGPFPAELQLETDLTRSLLIENLLSYTQNIGQHNINAVVGYTQNREFQNLLEASRTTFPDQRIQVLTGGTAEISNDQWKRESRLNSYLGRLSYTLADRYITELSFRRDGSSRFGPENRWGNFYAGSLGWVMSDELFFPSIPLLGSADFFRLRGSYGTQGNQDFADYQWQATVAGSGGGSSTRAPGNAYIRGEGEGSVRPGAIVLDLNNPAIRWQDNTMQNYGVDIGLLDNQLSFTAEYFVSRSGGLLARVPVVPSVGSNASPFVNSGSIENSGVEFSLQHTYNRPGLELNTGLNLSKLENEVLSLGTADEALIVGASRTAVGFPMGHFYMYETCGVFDTAAEIAAHGAQADAIPGDLCFVDHDGDGQIDSFDRTFLGSPWPDFEGGLFLDGRFSQIDFMVGVRGVFGNEVYNSSRPGMENMTGDSNSPVWLNPWTPENPTDSAPRAYWGGIGADNARGPNDRFLEDGSYVKLQNVQLGYTLPSSVLDRVGFRTDQARIYLNFQDIYTYTNYLGWDPEFRGGALTPGEDSGTRYPNPRTLSIGIDLGF